MTPARVWSPLPAGLTTARLTLGPWRDDDLDLYETMVHERDPRAAAAPRGGRPTRQDLRERITRQQRAFEDTGIGLYVIRRDGAFLGWCGLVVGHASLDEPELAYELLQAQHRRGYATEAAESVVAAAAATGRPRLWSTVRPWNDASFRVLHRVGFVRSGRVTTDDFGDSVWCTRDLAPTRSS